MITRAARRGSARACKALRIAVSVSVAMASLIDILAVPVPPFPAARGAGVSATAWAAAWKEARATGCLPSAALMVPVWLVFMLISPFRGEQHDWRVGSSLWGETLPCSAAGRGSSTEDPYEDQGKPWGCGPTRLPPSSRQGPFSEGSGGVGRSCGTGRNHDGGPLQASAGARRKKPDRSESGPCQSARATVPCRAGGAWRR